MTLHYLTLHYMTITLHCIPSNKQTHMYIHTYIHTYIRKISGQPTPPSQQHNHHHPTRPLSLCSSSSSWCLALANLAEAKHGIAMAILCAWRMLACSELNSFFILYIYNYIYILQCYYFSRFLAFSARQLQFVHAECDSNTDQSSDCTPSKRGSMRKV